MTEKTTSTNPLDIFIVGVRKGINIALLNLTPNVLMAFVFAHMLTLLGVMDLASTAVLSWRSLAFRVKPLRCCWPLGCRLQPAPAWQRVCLLKVFLMLTA